MRVLKDLTGVWYQIYVKLDDGSILGLPFYMLETFHTWFVMFTRTDSFLCRYEHLVSIILGTCRVV